MGCPGSRKEVLRSYIYLNIRTLLQIFKFSSDLSHFSTSHFSLRAFETGRALWIFGILQAGSTLAFSALASVGHNYYVLVTTVTFENFTSGMGASAFIAFMASLCNKRFTATQYALLSSLMGIPAGDCCFAHRVSGRMVWMGSFFHLLYSGCYSRACLPLSL